MYVYDMELPQTPVNSVAVIFMSVASVLFNNNNTNLIFFKVFVKCKILFIETILSE